MFANELIWFEFVILLKNPFKVYTLYLMLKTFKTENAAFVRFLNR